MLKRIPVNVLMDISKGIATEQEKELVRKISAHNDKVNSVPKHSSTVSA